MVLTLVVSSFVIFAGPERIAAVRAQYHLDEPLWTQYWLWAKGAVQGDLGRSMYYQQPVSDLLSTRLPNTLTLVALATVLIVLLGVGLWVLSALRKGTAPSPASPRS